MVDPARVLVVNDDGIEAPGIKALVARLVREGLDVRVVAPAVEQSAKSGAMTVHGVLEAEVHAYAEAGALSPAPLRCFTSRHQRCAVCAHGRSTARPSTVSSSLSVSFCRRWTSCRTLCSLGSTGYTASCIARRLISTQGNNAGLNPLCSGTVGAALAAKTHGLNSVALSLDHPATYVSGEPHALVLPGLPLFLWLRFTRTNGIMIWLLRSLCLSSETFSITGL